jgi:biopolymer transport protein ExbD
MQDRRYQKKKALVEKFIKKSGGKIDHSVILNSVDVDYDTLMTILSELRNEGRLK